MTEINFQLSIVRMSDKSVSAASPRAFAARMGLWLLILTITILFLVISLLFMVAKPGETKTDVPAGFFLTTLLLAGSSISLQMAWINRKNTAALRWLDLSIALALLFLAGQGLTWWNMASEGILFAGSGPRVSYLYVLTGLHAAHLLGGLGLIGYVRAAYLRGGMQRLDMALYFWHFLGLLWVYLIGVMAVNL
jgi:cytochrome c oxidase subunit III